MIVGSEGVCAQCGGSYIPSRLTPGLFSKYCGPECKKIAKRAFDKVRIRHRLPKQWVPRELSCLHCSSPFMWTVRTERNKYCSQSCRSEVRRNQQAQRPSRGKRAESGRCEITCIGCGKQYYRKPSRKSCYCSLPCYRARSKEKWELFRDLVSRGKTRKEIVQITGETEACVSAFILKTGLGGASWAVKWTPERDEAVRDGKRRGLLNAEILDIVNALPGPLLTHGALKNRAVSLGAKVPKELRFVPSFRTGASGKGKKYVRKHRRSLDELLPDLPESIEIDAPPPDWAPGGAKPPRDLPWETICEIAEGDAYFLANMHDLPSYNRSRIRRGLAPLAVRMSQEKQFVRWR